MPNLKKTQVVMLPTKEKANIFDVFGKLEYHSGKLTGTYESKNKHLYFLSDDKIEVDDWCMCIGDIYDKSLSIAEHNPKILRYTGQELGVSKIIVSTNTSLKIEISKGFIGKDYELPQPSQDFIRVFVEEYNKGKVIEHVYVRYILEWDEDKGHSIERLETNSKNEISIKKIKGTYTRDEVIKLIKKTAYKKHNGWKAKELDEWIEKNL